MKNGYCRIIAIVFLGVFFIYGCNVVPKSVQYQKEEEKLIGNTDIVNPVVEEIQVLLDSIGYKVGDMDGLLGTETRKAIKKFQESIGVRSTGYIDKLTLTELEDIRRARDEVELKKDYTVNVREGYPGERGTSKVSIRQIQTALKNAGFDPGLIDGKMGPRTRQAIKEFQKTKGLNPDGIVGRKTWTKLSRYLEP